MLLCFGLTPLTVGNERIQGIEITGKQKLILLSVYMPCKGSANHIEDFNNCLDQLHEIFETYQNTHQIIIGGDFNEDFIKGNDNPRKQNMMKFTSEHNLKTKYLGSTFIHPNGSDSSAIDFFLYQFKDQDKIIEIKKLDVIGNVSDHYPLKLTIQFDHSKQEYGTKQDGDKRMPSTRINWDKIDKNKYQKSIELKLTEVNLELNNIGDISSTLENLNNIIIEAAENVNPKRKHGHRKPKLQVMNEAIHQAIREKKTAFYIWKTNGRSKDPTNSHVANKKLTTQILRKECRLEIAQRRIQERERLIQARTSDQRTFYKLIRKQRGQLAKQIENLNVDGTSYSSDSIMNGWQAHFGNLAKKEHNKHFDNDFLQQVENEVETIMEICRDNYIHQPIEMHEINKAVSSLNHNKAADIFGITAENIIYGGLPLHQVIHKIIDKLFEFGTTSDILKTGLLFPVYKNKGDQRDAKFYRGITITPVLSKIIEKIIKNRENNKILEKQNPLQRGFTQETSPLLCELFIEEFERDSSDLNLPTYIAFLDSKAAFDVVVHANLIRRLFQTGFTYQSILMIESLYDNATSCVKWKGQFSEKFKIAQGSDKEVL